MSKSRDFDLSGGRKSRGFGKASRQFRHASTHAAGIVISREPLTDVVPLQRATSQKDDDDSFQLPTTQYAMAEVAKIGLVKMDFLGLRNLTILSNAVRLIRQTTFREVDPYRFPQQHVQMLRDFGPEVNLANVTPGQVLRLEGFRRGIGRGVDYSIIER